MSTSLGRDERRSRRALVLRPSSRAANVSASGGHAVSHGAGHASGRRRFSLCAGSRVLEKRHAARVLDDDGNDVTPQPLSQADPSGAHQAKVDRFFVEDITGGSASEQATAAGSFTMPFSRSLFGSSRISSLSAIESINEEIEDIFSKRDIPINYPDEHKKRDTVEEEVTEEMLKEVIDVYISETDSVSLLDIPSTVMSVDTDESEAIIERNRQYAEVCRNRMGNDKYMERSMQTLSGAAKDKHVQSDAVVMVNTATSASTWDIYDALCSPVPQKTNYPEAVVDMSRSAERSMSVGSTASTATAVSSLKEVDAFGSTSGAESDLQLIMQSETFQNCLLVMEKSILGNTFQPDLAAYRQLPVLEDPDFPVRQRKEETESGGPPALQRLWAFSCELNRGRSVRSMAWNKKNTDLLAVGYGENDSGDLTPGLVCCWSLKNPTWPERVLHCDSAVTSLDFSANNPSRLAVGMLNGNIAIYDVQGREQNSHVVSSSECLKKHLGPVWQLRYNQQGLSFAGEKVEELFSVSAEGRISRWFEFNTGLDCTDVMKLKRIHNTKKKARGNNTEKTGSVLTAMTPGLCFDFYPTDPSVYLVGTQEGLIHSCSSSNNQHFLDTFRKHFCAVNCVAWCPLSPDVFLSCSSDWTIQLWKLDQLNPVLGFTSIQRAVCDIKWSPKWATIFGAVNEGQLEIWDLNSSFLDPVAVQPAAPGVTMKSLLFTSRADCVLVGDSDGQVTVYQLKNLRVGESSQVDILQDLCSEASS
ncbi:dynein axonemal intermediate chain 4-like isoform X3 [Scophthalmus maximus]|uniref:dynein axonemal intermediate chain 4-like isoform X3 n=1 Tax=Scophthalmus maximus TaxID=52904 RepID=UPI001FA93FE7|nr:dynein axonemal intermediate chain 4-like isoform X3 [Scophthalmus maximus]